MEELLNFELDVDALNVGEMSYELQVRNIVINGTGRQKAIELRKAIEMESKPPLKVAEDKKEFNMAIEMLGDLQKELKIVIEEGDVAKEKLVKSRIRHYQDRAFRAAGNSEEADSILYGAVRNIKRIMRMSTEEREEASRNTLSIENTRPSLLGRGRGRKSTPPQSLRNVSPPTRRDDKLPDRGRSSASLLNQQRRNTLSSPNDDRELNKMFENFRFQDADDVGQRQLLNRSDVKQKSLDSGWPRLVERRKVAMEKWPVRFSGDGSISLYDFLRKVELYAEADDVEMKDIYRGIFKLLEGIALEWYEVNAVFINSWEDLVRGLKNRFMSKNFDYMVREEILAQMQAPNEPIADYLMKMTKLFLKVYPPLEEGYKVYVLQRNMLSHYRLQLTVADVSSVAQLEKLCKNMDEAKLMDTRQQYHYPKQAPTSSPVPLKKVQFRLDQMKNVAAVESVRYNPPLDQLSLYCMNVVEKNVSKVQNQLFSEKNLNLY